MTGTAVSVRTQTGLKVTEIFVQGLVQNVITVE